MERFFTWITRASLGILILGGLVIYIVPNSTAPNSHLTVFFQDISSLSTLLLVLLTATYVYTNNRQLLVMASQLDETQKNRELEQQPLPWVEISKAYIERPRVFMDIPNKKVCVIYRIRLQYKVRNVGNGIAIGVDIIPRLTLRHGKEECLESAVVKRVEILEKGQDAPIELTSMFVEDEQYVALRSYNNGKINDLPTVSLTVLFKNFLGATFKAESKYLLYQYNGDREVVADWLVKLTNLSVELGSYTSKVVPTKDQLQGLFDTSKAKFDSVKLLGEGDLILSPYLLPNSFALSQISPEEYQEIRQSISYPKALIAERRETKAPESVNPL